MRTNGYQGITQSRNHLDIIKSTLKRKWLKSQNKRYSGSLKEIIPIEDRTIASIGWEAHTRPSRVLWESSLRTIVATILWIKWTIHMWMISIRLSREGKSLVILILLTAEWSHKARRGMTSNKMSMMYQALVMRTTVFTGISIVFPTLIGMMSHCTYKIKEDNKIVH